jgi:hypothetical protein
MSGIELDGAVLGYTHFAHQDLTDMRHIEIIRCYAPSYIDLMTVTLPPMSSALATFLGGTVQSPYLIEALQGTILPLADVPVNIFLSYIESDREFAAGLRPHLELLNSVRLIEEPIPLACQELWQRNVEGCENAHLMVLLISAPFLASPIVKEQILEPGLQHLKKGKLLVPVIVRPVNWQESPLQGLQSLPIQGLPVSRWSDRDDALHTIAQDLQSLVRELYKKLLEEASRQRQRDLLLAQLIQTRTTSAEERRKLSTAQTQIREASKAVADAAKHLQEAQKNLQEAQEMLQTYTQQEQELQQRVTTMQQTETDLLAHIKELKLTPDGETSG